MSRDSSPGGFLRGVVLVAAAQAYFLLHAEFGLLDLLERADLGGSLRLFMGMLAAGGLGGCLWAALDQPARAAFRLRAACLLAAAGAFLSLGGTFPFLAAGSLVSGLGLGLWTASLAGSLTNYFSSLRLGLGAGLGVGLAYAFCNLPGIFNLGGRGQAAIAGGLALAGLACVSPEPARFVPRGASTFRPFLPWLGLFLALVWFDSAIFYLFNHLPPPAALPDLAPLSNPWAAHHLPIAFVHLVAAIAAGWAWDRGWGRSLLAGSFAGLLLAAWHRSLLLPEGPAALADTASYAAAVSVYTTLLVAFPSSGRVTSLSPTLQAALLYAVAGWVGSALGIGLAQDLGRVPAPLLAALACAVVGCSLGLRRLFLFGSAAAVSAAVSHRSAGETASPDPRLAEGAALFRNEGCFHCHSQFSRPLVEDVVLWGPTPDLGKWLAQTPPLPGNRRQGPDLSEVGLRRGPAWIAGHLSGRLPEGSRMPDYRHLSETQREALTAYLSSLGQTQAAARAALAASWSPDPAASPAASPAKLFAAHCASCHGPDGRGNGPWAASLPRPPRNLVSEPFIFMTSNVTEPLALARAVKFGIAGTEMPGHEWLSDSEILALANFVGTMRLSITN